jgi:ubiquinone/menaquinone biosynthesis C-methylase UbiE/uncharacterized protein YbaR (Trm112 family)
MKKFGMFKKDTPLNFLCCPHCGSELSKINFEEDKFLLHCASCDRIYPFIDGIAILCEDSKKNKGFEIDILSSFLGKVGGIDKKVGGEIEKIRLTKTKTQWEWEDVEFWDRIYQEKWKKRTKYSSEDRFFHWQDRLWQRALLANKLKSLLDSKKQNVLLDVGCGEGQNMLLFEKTMLSRLLYIGIDMSFYGLKLARYLNEKLFPDFLFILCPADRIPLKKNSVDIITCFGVLHHCPQKEKTLSSFDPLLKNRRFLLLHEPYNKPSVTPPFLKLKVLESAHEERIERPLLRRALSRLGYRPLIAIESYSFLFGFLMRFLPKFMVKNGLLFRLTLKLDTVFIKIFSRFSPKLGPGDFRGLYQK